MNVDSTCMNDADANSAVRDCGMYKGLSLEQKRASFTQQQRQWHTGDDANGNDSGDSDSDYDDSNDDDDDDYYYDDGVGRVRITGRRIASFMVDTVAYVERVLGYRFNRCVLPLYNHCTTTVLPLYYYLTTT